MRISDWSSDVCSSDLEGGAAKHDIAVAVADMPGFIERTIPIVEAAFPGARVLAFGHLGDGNVHFNVRPPIGENRSEEHTSELQSLMRISYAVFCLKKKIIRTSAI